MTVTLYGLKTCDTCRKAVAFLTARDCPPQFHDLRADGLGEDMLDGWIGVVGWEALLNRRSTTWRALPDEAKEGLDPAGARLLLLDNPTLVKRPVIALGDLLLVGFAAAQQAALAEALEDRGAPAG